MAGITLTQAEENLDAAQAAYQKALRSKSYSVGSSRSQVNHDIDKLRAEVQYWDGEVRRLARGTSGIRIRGGTPT